MMKAKKEDQHGPSSANAATHDEDGKIRVTGGRKKRFSIFKKPGQEPVKEDVSYEPETLKGRNPMEAGGSKKPSASRRATWDPQASNPLDGRNPVDFGATDPYGNPIKKNYRSTSVKDRNPVDFNATDPYGNPIDGRNPRDFGATDPYGNPIKPKTTEARRSSCLDGRNPRDFDGSDPYGNPIKTNKSTAANKRGSLNGRNPKDFDRPCDPYGNPIPQDDRRNPSDFDGPCDPYGNPIPQDEDSLAGRNPKDFDGARDPYGNPAVPQDERRNSMNDSSRRTSMKDTSETGRRRSSKISAPPSREKEEVKLQETETIKREIKKNVPEWADPNFNKTKRRSTIKNVPKGEREKFSLKTYHHPRGAVPS